MLQIKSQDGQDELVQRKNEKISMSLVKALRVAEMHLGKEVNTNEIESAFNLIHSEFSKINSMGVDIMKILLHKLPSKRELFRKSTSYRLLSTLFDSHFFEFYKVTEFMINSENSKEKVTSNDNLLLSECWMSLIDDQIRVFELYKNNQSKNQGNSNSELKKGKIVEIQKSKKLTGIIKKILKQSNELIKSFFAGANKSCKFEGKEKIPTKLTISLLHTGLNLTRIQSLFDFVKNKHVEKIKLLWNIEILLNYIELYSQFYKNHFFLFFYSLKEIEENLKNTKYQLNLINKNNAENSNILIEFSKSFSFSWKNYVDLILFNFLKMSKKLQEKLKFYLQEIQIFHLKNEENKEEDEENYLFHNLLCVLMLIGRLKQKQIIKLNPWFNQFSSMEFLAKSVGFFFGSQFGTFFNM